MANAQANIMEEVKMAIAGETTLTLLQKSKHEVYSKDYDQKK
jgi:hypothetical protein